MLWSTEGPLETSRTGSQTWENMGWIQGASSVLCQSWSSSLMSTDQTQEGQKDGYAVI